MKEVRGKHIVVIGAARSGVAVAGLLHRRGAVVFVTDNGPISDPVKISLRQGDIPFEEQGHSDRARGADFAVVSPGVPTEAPLVQEYFDEGKRVFSEIEVASWFNKSPIVAVTGSNGKTTVTSWIAHTWKTARKPHLLAGNIGCAFSEKADQTRPRENVILEVSSFQLDHIESFRPHISLILNITPDHMDRYQHSLEKYAEAKFRITQNQTAEDWFIYNYDDPVIKPHVETLKKKRTHPGFWLFQAGRNRRKEVLLCGTGISS